MRYNKTFCTMAVAITFLIFYFTVNVEINAITGSVGVTNQAHSTRRPLTTHITVASEDLRKVIPQDAAYWNRLFYSAVKSLDAGDSPVRKESPWSVCREENQDFLRLNVHDFNSHPPLFQTFLKGMNCRAPPILIDQPMKCHNKTFLLLAVKSSPASFERRQAVRETWGREGLYQSDRRVRLVFFLGKNPPDDPDVGAVLSFEAKRFGDIVQWDFHESLLNLTLKMDLFLQWTVRNCPWVSFVFSGDDDVFVNTDALVGYLESLDAAKSSRLYVGQVLNTASPLRDPRSKYFIPQTFYSGPYPAYAGGGGFVVSGELMQSLSLVSKSFPLFPIDDVYMGLCMKALGIAPESHQGFQTFDIRKEDRENVCVHKYLLLIHQRTPRQIKKMWNDIHNPLLTC
ncbi:N-acetyllactosaminide beta-1,3-N-acetylglucosaminyltransferase 2 [Fundulus heteroclitus]|uniref:N-acetyllactosaminide beta-1,3-N-acetylglucosaminyltransferase 2 n=1 Tax=Fundulus heteroclitus TaxID=8078 RepID=UPI00165AD938|nr:N-acetyllactosaminide beta-1,3-N-acetylglucosaminyltransferase 2 [Fundulus heteroclitus]XP_036005801.1 N-acetyllactosaminide beta-1,3-N-acetylglucosaminyltransferase 2 [Fundulus heteroclitus]XP_036005802.1 N-acetyllactosaminide beta-1,3-N-acetylglucosaminyltransferase 2 [Fundulus heteroclitus]